METKMNIYEFVTPSDPITFKANDDRVAFICAVLLGNGKAGCNNVTTGVSIPSMMIFVPNPGQIMSDFIGSDPKEFIGANKQKISDCFRSFAYGSVSDRETYDAACDAITDPEKLEGFKKKHEDKNRSSMSQWVLSAWEMADSILK